MNEKKRQVVILHETVLQSWGRDLGTFSLFAALIGLGVYLESTAMQWAGFIVVLLTVFARATKAGWRIDPQEAADWLRDEYGVTAEPDRSHTGAGIKDEDVERVARAEGEAKGRREALEEAHEAAFCVGLDAAAAIRAMIDNEAER